MLTIASPTLLPVATGQPRRQSEYDALDVPGLAAGESYPDPVTGVTIYKVTDASSPVENIRGVHDYSEGGPFISLPWGPSQEMYSIYFRLRVSGWEAYIVDFNIETGAFSNGRSTNVVSVNDLRFAFSNNPNTPRIAYLIQLTSSSTLDRYDTETMQAANIGNFPHTFPDQAGWLHQDKDDRWFVAAGTTWGVAAWNSETNVEYTYFPSGFDEPHLDRGGNYVAIARDRNSPEVPGVVGNIDIMDLSDGSIDATLDRAQSHIGSLVDYFVYVYPHASKGKRPQRRINADGSNKTDIIVEPDYVGSSGHRAGQWITDNDTGTSQWYVASHYAGSTFPGAHAVVFVRADGSDVRFLAHHYSEGSDSYRRQPHATVSPDGRLVMWTSDMNNPNSGSVRVDVFLAVVPLKDKNMTQIIDADLREMYLQLYRKGEGKEEIKADGLLSPMILKAIFQAIEDWFEAERPAIKVAIVAAAGRPMTNAAAKKYGRAYLRWKWGLE